MRRMAALLISSFLFWLSWNVVRDDYTSRRWVPVTGVVVVSKRVRDFKDYSPVIRYRYAAGGRTYENGDEHARKPWPRTTIGEANDIVAKYRVGSPVTVFYDPGNPAQSAVEPGLTFGDFVLPLLAFVFLGAAALAKDSAPANTAPNAPTTFNVSAGSGA